MGNFISISEPVIIRCPECEQRLMDIESSKKPFKSDVLELLIKLNCPRCNDDVEIILNNSKN